jgi:hypothetical protein
MYFFTCGRDRGVPVEEPLMMCYNLINAYIPDMYVFFLFVTMFHPVCAYVLLCESEECFVIRRCVFLKGVFSKGGPCQITKKRQKKPFEVSFVF